MKYIFDFDDVLVNTTPSRNPRNFREHIYASLEKVGIPPYLAREYIEKERLNQFSLKKMLTHFSLRENLYDEIMIGNKDFINEELLKIVRKIGKVNCYIITYGDEEFQMDKITRTGISELFSGVIAVPGSKKNVVEEICIKHQNEEVIFIDDKAKHFEDLDMKKCPNLKTILYTGQDMSYL